MNRPVSALAALALLSLAACAPGPGPAGPRGYRGPPLALKAQPGEVVAAELAFARMAKEDGQWTAFREFAADDGKMLAPRIVNVRDHLKGRADPPESVTWQPHHVWSSCDGSVAVTRGAWQRPDGSVGWFSTVWQRQQDGSYRYLFDHGDVLDTAEAGPDMIGTTTASCDNLDAIQPPFVPPPTSPDTQYASGESADKTLRWIVRSEPDGSGYYGFDYWNGQAFERPLAQILPAPEG